MKIESLKEKLLNGIQKAEKVTSKNTSLPVLKCVLLEASKGSLIVRSTNLDVGLEITVPVKLETEGILAVPGGIAASVLAQLPSDKSITLESKDGSLLISSAKNSTLIKAFPADDYPSIPKVDEDAAKSFKIASGALVSGLKAVWYSSANSNIKPELSSVRMYPVGDELVFVATDGFRLAEKRVPVKGLPEFTHVLIPVRNASEIIRIFDGLDEEIEVLIDDNQIAVKSDHIYLVSRTIEGNFPDYKAIIPKEFATEAVVLKQDFVNSLKVSTIFSDAYFHVKFQIKPGDKKFEMVTRNSDIGESLTELPAALTGQDLDMNFNYRYINDCISVLSTDSMTFAFGGANRPLVIKPVSDASFLYLVMPMNK
ncbi:MAG TPA: DNA polymerase III subunit beta [Candidatus Paceibacterota bacterium]